MVNEQNLHALNEQLGREFPGAPLALVEANAHFGTLFVEWLVCFPDACAKYVVNQSTWLSGRVAQAEVFRALRRQLASVRGQYVEANPGPRAASLWDEVLAGAKAIARYWYPDKAWENLSGTGHEDSLRLSRLVIEALGKLHDPGLGGPGPEGG